MNINELPENIWKSCIDSVPIFGIDLIIYFKKRGILMGRRINNPAKDKLFVPGGRVYKNEARKDAFKRILKNETGLNIKYTESSSIGLFEHFYDLTYWSSKNSSTHYIIEARLIELEIIDNDINMSAQHSNLEWINLNNFESDDIHFYSKLYLKRVSELI